MVTKTNQSLIRSIEPKVTCVVWWLATVSTSTACIGNWYFYLSENDPLGRRNFQDAISGMWSGVDGSVTMFFLMPHVFTLITVATWGATLSATKQLFKQGSNSHSENRRRERAS